MSAHSAYTQTFSLTPPQRAFVGRLIGRKGVNIKALKEESGASSIKWESQSSQFVITGRVGAVTKAQRMLTEKVAKFESDESSLRSYQASRQHFSTPKSAPQPSQPAPKKKVNTFAMLEGLEEKREAEAAEARRLAEEDAELDAAWAGMVKSAAIVKKPKSDVDSELAFGGSFVKERKKKGGKKSGQKKVTRIILGESGPSQFMADARERNDVAWEDYKVERAKQQAAFEERQRKRKEKASKMEQERQAQLSRVGCVGRF